MSVQPDGSGYDLHINAEVAIETISSYLKDLLRRDDTKGVLIGLSGGLDSSVLAALAVRALGPDCVTAMYLSDRVSDPELAKNAWLIADWLGLELETRDITDEMRKRGVYRPLFLKLLQISPLFARLSVAVYRLLCQENPFLSSLLAGGGGTLRPWWKRLLFNMTMYHVDAGFRERHIFRRDILEREAQARGLSLIGGANRSEFEVGWFVKDGIDDLPVQPMTGLFKTQVRQLADVLGLPDAIRHQLPSPDMAKGVTDEFGIGHDYAVVDIVIDALDRGLRTDDIAALGVPLDQVEDILAIRTLSEWKRASPHEDAPVSGRAGSPLREGASAKDSVA